MISDPAVQNRCARLLVVGMLGALAGIVALLLYEQLVNHLGNDRRWARPGPAKAAGLLVIAAFAALQIPGLLPRRGRHLLDAFATRMLDGPLTAAAVGVILMLLLTWVPDYLTWPWFTDADQFAVSAQSWDAGLVPYRDLPDFDFPGPIYLHYLLGKTCGWGHTVPLAALDASFLVILGTALAAWSRRRFGSMLPGLAGYLLFLCYYLRLDYIQVAQRDWHGPFFASLGLLALETLPGRCGRYASALFLAVALAFRPQVVLFLPAVAVAVVATARRSGEGWLQVAWPLGKWAVAFAASLALAFAPLILQGALDDFLIRLQIAGYGGEYNHVTWSSFVSGLSYELGNPLTLAMLVAGALLSRTGSETVRRSACTWSVALVGALLYKPISPVPHAYLDHARTLICSISLAPVMAGLLTMPRLLSSLRLAGVLVLVVAAGPLYPEYCSVTRSVRAFEALVKGATPIDPPAGCERQFRGPARPRGPYRWEDYRALLAHLRAAVPTQTHIANFLRAHPYPTVNGPTGHLSTFPAAGGLMHLWSVDPGVEDQYAEALAHTRESVVVWVPDETAVNPRLRLPGLARTIRRHYSPEARFGNLEVWRHKSSSQSQPPKSGPRGDGLLSRR